jgi:transcriptional regulator with XRE-family HTH domain
VRRGIFNALQGQSYGADDGAGAPPSFPRASTLLPDVVDHPYVEIAGKEVMFAIKRSGRGIAEVSSAAGMARSRMGIVTSSRRTLVSMDAACRLADALNVELREILADDEVPRDKKGRRLLNSRRFVRWIENGARSGENRLEMLRGVLPQLAARLSPGRPMALDVNESRRAVASANYVDDAEAVVMTMLDSLWLIGHDEDDDPDDFVNTPRLAGTVLGGRLDRSVRDLPAPYQSRRLDLPRWRASARAYRTSGPIGSFDVPAGGCIVTAGPVGASIGETSRGAAIGRRYLVIFQSGDVGIGVCQQARLDDHAVLETIIETARVDAKLPETAEPQEVRQVTLVVDGLTDVR